MTNAGSSVRHTVPSSLAISSSAGYIDEHFPTFILGRQTFSFLSYLAWSCFPIVVYGCWRLKWVLAGANTRRRRKRCAVTWRIGEGPSDKGCPWNLSCHRRHFKIHHLDLCCFRFSLFCLTRGKYRTFGGLSLSEWKSLWEKGPKGWMLRNSHSLIVFQFHIFWFSSGFISRCHACCFFDGIFAAGLAVQTNTQMNGEA